MEIAKDVFYVGVNHKERKVFDELIPLSFGTSYNSYVVRGKEKVALIDTADPAKEKEYLANLRKLGLKIDYIISNHAEQDHSGLIPKVLEMFPSAKVVTNPKCREFLKDLLLVPDDRFITVNDNETLSLGGKTLRFILAPWVHWPETMLTFLEEDRVLFSCDLFGSHYAPDLIILENEEMAVSPAKVYYAEIMMPFRGPIAKYITKVQELNPQMIAPSHGFVYPRPDFIISQYKDWISDKPKDLVVILYVSMHGSTERMVMHTAGSLTEKGLQVKAFNLADAGLNEIAESLVDAATIILASPAFLIGPHPLMANAAILLNALKPKAKFAAVIGSYGWGAKVEEQLRSLMPSLRWQALPPVTAKGLPNEEVMKRLEELSAQIVEHHKVL